MWEDIRLHQLFLIFLKCRIQCKRAGLYYYRAFVRGSFWLKFRSKGGFFLLKPEQFYPLYWYLKEALQLTLLKGFNSLSCFLWVFALNKKKIWLLIFIILIIIIYKKETIVSIKKCPTEWCFLFLGTPLQNPKISQLILLSKHLLSPLMKKFHQLLRTIKPRNERTGSLAIFNIGLKRLQIHTFTQKIKREILVYCTGKKLRSNLPRPLN